MLAGTIVHCLILNSVLLLSDADENWRIGESTHLKSSMLSLDFKKIIFL